MQIIVYAVRKTGTAFRVSYTDSYIYQYKFRRLDFNLDNNTFVILIVIQGRDYSGYRRLVPVSAKDAYHIPRGIAYATYMICNLDTKQLRTSQELRKKEFVVG